MALRAIFFSVSVVLGLGVGFSISSGDSTYLLAGAGLGALLSGTIIAVEQSLQHVPSVMTIGGGVGFSIGVVLAGVLIFSAGQIFPQSSLVTQFGTMAVLIVLPYLGLVVGLRLGKLSDWEIGAKEKETLKGYAPVPKLLDTSVIIDGRIADLCETGFIEGGFIIPQFILQELQHISDSADSLKRARGRRGLDILNHIQKKIDIEVTIVEEDFPHIKEVDAKLVELGKKLGAKIFTNDLNLNKVAELQGVRVLNINDLTNALKPVVLPGETIRVFVLKEGKEAGQGVAYLDDGTMVVVDNAKRCIGKNVDVIVTSVLQTSAGRMIFTRLKEESDRDELSFARG
ncbi:MAG: TRAM domain-containing protein [Nitrospirae bacterium]|nr:TRAM domain-containing protein [Nitrospirota bacterium]MDA1304245.1 TRAM domain-containing protein [Nitrospirota bacterium]